MTVWTEERRRERSEQMIEWHKTYTMSEEARQKMSAAHKGIPMKEESKQKLSASQKERLRLNPFDDEYKQKQVDAHKGIPLGPKSEDHKQKISKSLKNFYDLHPLTQEQKLEPRRFQKGNNNWLGLHHTEETKKKLSESSKITSLGNKSNTGRKGKFTPEHLLHMSQGMKGKNTGKRPPFSEEWRKKLGDAQRGKPKNFTPEHKRNIAIAHFELWTRQRVSKPQKELFLFLKQIFPDATMELPVKTNRTYRFADIGIPSKQLDFEYDGEYWHNEKRAQLDRDRDAEMAEAGWMTFRINKDILKALCNQKTTLQELLKK